MNSTADSAHTSASVAKTMPLEPLDKEYDHHSQPL